MAATFTKSSAAVQEDTQPNSGEVQEQPAGGGDALGHLDRIAGMAAQRAQEGLNKDGEAKVGRSRRERGYSRGRGYMVCKLEKLYS